MAHTLGEHALSRVLEYMAGTGAELTDAHTLIAFKLIEEGLQSGQPDLMAWVMDELPLRFDLPQRPLPPVAPAIVRGSIGYGDKA
uniref:hypothetical protein n=1 Tax=Marinobacterium profundum TaxID=1714300 RepID=UPI00082BC525|nr:hypothetical protein [Marinobacterium profundum]